MSYAITINGRSVSKEEADAYYARKRQIFGIPEREFLEHSARLITDDTLFQRDGIGWAPHEVPQYAAMALRQGFNPHGKRYFSQLADYGGDLKAWCSSRGDMIRRLREMDVESCTGAVKLQRNIDCKDPGPEIGIDDDLIHEEVAGLLEENPEIAPTPKEKEELFHTIRDKRKPHWVKD